MTPSAAQDFTIDLPNNRLAFTRQGDTLVVSFDNAGAPHRDPPDRPAWGHKFFAGEGHSVLGVIAKQSDWYRCPELHQALCDLRDRGFFAAFRTVVLTGSSMGGFAATAFASLAPGCHVISYNPQSTLRRDLVGWDNSHPSGIRQNWDGPFSDGAEEARAAAVVYILFDPFHEEDVRHARRYDAPNVRHLRTPFLGHGLPDALKDMGLLKEVMRHGIAGTLDRGWYARAIRGRRQQEKYYKEIVRSLVRHGKVAWGVSLMQRAFQTFGDPYFRYREALFQAAAGNLPRAITLLDYIDRARRAEKRRKK